MANICDMRLYIVSNTKDDAKSLFISMASTFKEISKVDALSSIDSTADWKTIGDALCDAVDGYNGLCLLNSDPDTRSEGGYVSCSQGYGKPYICINMALKWGPSFQVAEYCAELAREKYGFAAINGGEYMCAMGDEIAYIQWGDDSGDPFDGGLYCSEFSAWKEKVLSKKPESLNDIALRLLFEGAETSDFFWKSAFQEIIERVDRVDGSLIDEIVEALEYEDREELIESFGKDTDSFAYCTDDIDDEDLQEGLGMRLRKALYQGHDVTNLEEKNPQLVADALRFYEAEGCEYGLQDLLIGAAECGYEDEEARDVARKLAKVIGEDISDYEEEWAEEE